MRALLARCLSRARVERWSIAASVASRWERSRSRQASGEAAQPLAQEFARAADDVEAREGLIAEGGFRGQGDSRPEAGLEGGKVAKPADIEPREVGYLHMSHLGAEKGVRDEALDVAVAAQVLKQSSEPCLGLARRGFRRDRCEAAWVRERAAAAAPEPVEPLAILHAREGETQPSQAVVLLGDMSVTSRSSAPPGTTADGGWATGSSRRSRGILSEQRTTSVSAMQGDDLSVRCPFPGAYQGMVWMAEQRDARVRRDRRLHRYVTAASVASRDRRQDADERLFAWRAPRVTPRRRRPVL